MEDECRQERLVFKKITPLELLHTLSSLKRKRCRFPANLFVKQFGAGDAGFGHFLRIENDVQFLFGENAPLQDDLPHRTVGGNGLLGNEGGSFHNPHGD